MTPRLEQFLAQEGVPYTHSIHRPAYTARDTAHVDHTPVREMAKTVVFSADGEYGIAVLPSNTYVDLEMLADSLGATLLRLATEEELLLLFPDVELGAMPAFGNLYGIPVYLDDRLAQRKMIAFNAGTHVDVVHMLTEDFMRLSGALVTRFAFKLGAARV